MIPNVLSTFLDENMIHEEKKRGLRCLLRLHKWKGRESVVYNPFKVRRFSLSRGADNAKLTWVECDRCKKKKRCKNCDSLHLYRDYAGQECNTCGKSDYWGGM